MESLSTLCLQELDAMTKGCPGASSEKRIWSIQAMSEEEPPVPEQKATGYAPLGFADRRGAHACQRHSKVGRCLPALRGLPKIRADGRQIPSSAGARRVTAAGRGRFLPVAQPVSPA